MENSVFPLPWVPIQFFEITLVTVWVAHTPSSLQSKLSDNAFLHCSVGSTPFHKAGIMLFNPNTKQTIVKRSFHQLNPTDEIIPYLPLSVSGIVSTDSTDQSSPMDSSPSFFTPAPNTNYPTRNIPYLLRSRNKLKSHLATLSSGTNTSTCLPVHYGVNRSTCSARALQSLPHLTSYQSVP